MALKDCETDNKSMPFLERKFYSNLIKVHPCQFFPVGQRVGGRNVLSHAAVGGRGPEVECPSAAGAEQGYPERFPDDVHGGTKFRVSTQLP